MSDTDPVADAAVDPTTAEPDADETDDTGATDDEPIRNMGELRRIRKELKESREKYGPLADALSGFDQNDLDFIVKEWLPSFHSDQSKFVAYTRQILDQLSPAEKAEVAQEVDEATEEKGSALTEAQIQAIVDAKLAEREQAAAAEAGVRQVHDDLKRLGFEDPDSVEAQQVLYLALKQTNGDIDKAVELHKANEQAIIDRYLESKGQGPTLPPKGSAAAPVKDEPQNLAEAKKAAAAYLASRGG